jgi:hypothetical protein
MEMKKTLGAIVAGFAVQFAGLFVIHGVWLKQDYINTADLWRTQDAMMHRMWIMLVADLIFVIGAVWIYARGVENKPWVGQGIRFGILLALVSPINGSLAGYVLLPISHLLVVKWMIGEGLLAIVLGLVIAAICKPKLATA